MLRTVGRLRLEACEDLSLLVGLAPVTHPPLGTAGSVPIPPAGSVGVQVPDYVVATYPARLGRA
jgi:hypothetical protein